LTGKFYEKYLACYFKMNVGGGANSLKYMFYYEYDVKCRLNMVWICVEDGRR